MNTECALCGTLLTSLDTLLGENKLSDGSVLCNKCLEKVSTINKELLYDLNKFSLADIKGLTEKVEIVPAVTTENQVELYIESDLVLKGDHSGDTYKERLKSVKSQLKQVNANLSVFTKGEIKKLPYILAADEKILAITDAQYVKTFDAGVLVLTPIRLISVSVSMLSSAKISHYPNETIASVSFVSDPKSPIIRLHTKDRIVEFECYDDKEDAEQFYDKIKSIYNDKEVQKLKSPAVKESSEAIFEQLGKLGQLRENGILTEEEFADQKKKLLEKLS